jgi:hypothetical protein
MNPFLMRDFLPLGQFDHMHRRCIAPPLWHNRHFNAASSFQIGVSRGRLIASSARSLLFRRDGI